VESSVTFGTSNPNVQITGTGATPQAAIRTANVVGDAVVGELERIQRVQQVDQRYRITTVQVEVPDGAQLQPSGQLRMLVGVLVLGTILLFIVVSVTDALETMRRDRVRHVQLDGLDEPWPAEPRGHQLHEPFLTNGDDLPDRREQEWVPSAR
jgi:capsular polysaccharide biosynthesis protein